MSQNHDLSKLPDFCYSILYTTGAIILIRNGESGYCSTPYSVEDRRVNTPYISLLQENLQAHFINLMEQYFKRTK